jgi:hypothetical protein
MVEYTDKSFMWLAPCDDVVMDCQNRLGIDSDPGNLQLISKLDLKFKKSFCFFFTQVPSRVRLNTQNDTITRIVTHLYLTKDRKNIYGAMTLKTTTFSMMTLCIQAYFVTLSINDIQYKQQSTICHYADCHYDECCVLFIYCYAECHWA